MNPETPDPENHEHAASTVPGWLMLAMRRRQQAEAIIATRTRIGHGAVNMVEMALHELKTKNVIEFDDERKAAMVSNLLVVLWGEAEVTPVVNAATLSR